MTDVVTSGPIAAKVSIYDLCDTDTSAEENGKWFEDIFGLGGDDPIGVRIRAWQSKPVQEALNRLRIANAKYTKNGKLPQEQSDAIFTHVLANVVILEWKGMYDRDGAVIECTPENVTALMTKLPRFRQIVYDMSSTLGLWRTEQKEAVTGN